MRFKEIKPLTEETLLEINMSPSALRKLSSRIDAKVGMEFEMYLPDVSEESEEADYDNQEQPEPDYDADERVTSIDQIFEFFRGEHNSTRRVMEVQDRLTEKYHRWLDADLDERWKDVAREHVIAYLRKNHTEQILAQAEEALSSNGQTPTSDQIQTRAMAIGKARLSTAMEQKDGNADWDQAKILWTEEDTNDEDNQEEYLNSVLELTTMQDVSREYDLEWPVWTEPEYQEPPDRQGRTLEEVAEDFYHRTGFRARVGFFSMDPPVYGVDFDGSLGSPDSDGDHGVEFSSPPFDYNTMIDHLKKVKQFAEDEGGYTNSTCGLHISVSIATSSEDSSTSWSGYGITNLDYVKLAVLLGDQHVLTQFERLGSRYCQSALNIVKDRIRQRPDDMKKLLDQLKGSLSNFASGLIHKGTTDKFTSINNKGNYIEFRSAGNDWLDSNFFNQIEQTTMRYIVALDAAMDPTKFQKEYATKLATMLTGGKEIEYYDPKDPVNAKFPTKFSRTRPAGWVPVPTQEAKAMDYLADYVAGKLSEREMLTFKELLTKDRPEPTYAPLPDRKNPIPTPPAVDTGPDLSKMDTTGHGRYQFSLLNAADNVVHTMFADTQRVANIMASEWLRRQGQEPGHQWTVVPYQSSHGMMQRYYVVPVAGGEPIGTVSGQTSDAAWIQAVARLRDQGLDPMQYMLRQS